MTTLAPRQSEVAKVTFGASIGSFIEWYDFFLATTAAAIVWPSVFFSSSNAAVGFIFSLSAFGVTFLARPIGGALFGHYGDKLGRKWGVYWTLVLTGIASLGIALTPSYTSIGIFGPVLLFVFRIVQGVGIGGDYGGAITWVGEFAHKSKWRGFWSSWIGVAVDVGIVVSSLSYFILVTTIPHTAFLIWGWRVLFGLAALVAVVGVVIRYKLAESPLFSELKERKAVESSPLVQTAKRNWGKLILAALPYGVVYAVANIEVNVYGQAYLAALHFPIPSITLAVAATAFVSIFFSLGGGILSDIFPRGRKWVLMIFMAFGAVFSIFIFPLFNSLNFIVIVLAMCSTYALMNATTGIFPAFFADQYRTSERYSGAGFGSQLGALVTGVFLTPILPILLSHYKTSLTAWQGVAELCIVALLIGMVSLLFFKENRPSDLATVE